MLVVQRGEATDPLPLAYGVHGMAATYQKDVEGHRGGAWVGASKSPLDQVAVEGEIYRGSLGVEGHQDRVHWH